MKKVIFLTMATALLGTVSVVAQEPVQQESNANGFGKIRSHLTPEQIAEMRVKDLVRKVPDLSEDQKNKSHEIFLQAAQEKLQANKSKEEVKKEVKSQLAQVLTPEQMAAYRAANKAQSQQRKADRENRGEEQTAPDQTR